MLDWWSILVDMQQKLSFQKQKQNGRAYFKPTFIYFAAWFLVPGILFAIVGVFLQISDDLSKPYHDLHVMAVNWCKMFVSAMFYFGVFGIIIGAILFAGWRLSKLVYSRLLRR